MKRSLTFEGNSKNTESQGTEGKKTLEDEVMEVQEDFRDGLKELQVDAIQGVD